MDLWILMDTCAQVHELPQSYCDDNREGIFFMITYILRQSCFSVTFEHSVYIMSIVPKSTQYYCRAFISINGSRIDYKYIIATNSLICVSTYFRICNMEENCLHTLTPSLTKYKFLTKFIV